MWSARQLAAERLYVKSCTAVGGAATNLCKQPNGVRRLMILLGRGIFLVKWAKLLTDSQREAFKAAGKHSFSPPLPPPSPLSLSLPQKPRMKSVLLENKGIVFQMIFDFTSVLLRLIYIYYRDYLSLRSVLRRQ